jgi:hypothetical protein
MDTKSLFEKYYSEMLHIAAKIAANFDATPNEANGDEFGFEFGIDRGDDIALVTLTLVPSSDFPQSANLIIRAQSDGDDSIINWAPDNYTMDCWAKFEDGDAWLAKFSAVRAQIDVAVNVLKNWENNAAPAP